MFFNKMIKVLFNIIKKDNLISKGFFLTNKGQIEFEFYTNKCTRTCYSFFDFFNKKKFPFFSINFKKYKNTIYDKENIYILDSVEKNNHHIHNDKGFLTIDNKGSLNTLSITLQKNNELNQSNVIFGRIIHREQMEELFKNEKDVLKINDLILHFNAFEFVANTKRNELFRGDKLNND